jgi:DNA-binding CsgD family transcriptional regulator
MYRCLQTRVDFKLSTGADVSGPPAIHVPVNQKGPGATARPLFRYVLFVYMVHLRELLSSLSPILLRTIDALSQQSTPRSIMTAPAMLVQTGLTPARHKDVRLELRHAQHRLTPVEIDALVATYKAGRSLAALGREFKLHKRTVHAHLVRAGVDLRPQQVLTPEQVGEVIGLYRSGATLKQLGPRFGVANASIRNYLIRAGIQLRAAKRSAR